MADVATSPLVDLVYSGEGEVRGSPMDQEIHWSKGSLHVEVEPDRGVELAVLTPEATVRVVGTVFEVVADAKGTRVEVFEGRVSVECDSGEVVDITAGGDHECWPTHPANLLERAQILTAEDASTEDILASLDAALALEPILPLRQPILRHRMKTLAEAGRMSEARQMAREYLEDPANVQIRGTVEGWLSEWEHSP